MKKFKSKVESQYQVTSRKTTKMLETPQFLVTVDETGKAGNIMDRKSLKVAPWTAPEMDVQSEGISPEVKQQMEMLLKGN